MPDPKFEVFVNQCECCGQRRACAYLKIGEDEEGGPFCSVCLGAAVSDIVEFECQKGAEG